MTDDIRIVIARLEERQQSHARDLERLKRDISEDLCRVTGRVDKQDSNIRFVVVGVLSAVLAGVMKLVLKV